MLRTRGPVVQSLVAQSLVVHSPEAVRRSLRHGSADSDARPGLDMPWLLLDCTVLKTKRRCSMRSVAATTMLVIVGEDDGWRLWLSFEVKLSMSVSERCLGRNQRPKMA